MGPVSVAPRGGFVAEVWKGWGGATAGVEGLGGGLETSASVDVESVLSVRSSFVSLVSVASTASVLSSLSVGSSVSTLEWFSVGGMSCVAVIGGLGFRLIGVLSGTSWP